MGSGASLTRGGFDASAASYRRISFLRNDWIAGFLITVILAFAIRMLEWPCWQNPEYKFGNEFLLATHDSYHWVAGACGFGRAVDHPMARMLRFFAGISGLAPAQAAFWLPAFLSSIAAGAVFLWGRLYSNAAVGIAAGLIASIAPGFLGRTLLGYYDTDLITLLFPLLIAFLPAVWLIKTSKAMDAASLFFNNKKSMAQAKSDSIQRKAYSPVWLVCLTASGLLAWQAQEWHSVFPYIMRYDIFFLLLFLSVFSGQRKHDCAMALAFALPAALGLWGIAWPLLLQARNHFKFLAVFGNKYLLIIIWACLAVYLLQGEIIETLINHVNAYLKRSSDTHLSGVIPLVFPSVAQSIIEVQDLNFLSLFPYFHPWLEAAFLGFAGFFAVAFKKPTILFLLPLAALGLLSSRMGGRMVMFGAPIMALGISLSCFWFFQFMSRRWLKPLLCQIGTATVLCAGLVLPFLDMIPALSQGPVLNKRHAAALAQAGAITPPDATLWLWWDWGYAAQYFARRNTIADGALHGGPSLYLPAAVLATANPRFAYQIIARVSSLDNEPGNFFKNMTPEEAQALMQNLANASTPLIRGKGRQYLIVSFEMLKLGFWISNFGNWNFLERTGEGGALSIVPEAVAYRVGAGEVRLEGRQEIIYPASINIFAETGLMVKNYIRQWFEDNPNASISRQKAWLASRRNINFFFNKVTDEKLAVDEGIYSSLMAQLLLCDAQDPKFTPYFRLVYDNIFARIYEIAPDGKF